MSLSDAHVGRTYPATRPYLVSREKIAEFARALGDDNPAYFADSPIAPPTFAAVIAAHAWEALFGDEELGLALNRTMHTDQGFTFHRPLRAGDVVHAQLGIEKVRNRGNLDMITVVVDLVVEGETVCEARSGLMHTKGDDNA